MIKSFHAALVISGMLLLGTVMSAWGAAYTWAGPTIGGADWQTSGFWNIAGWPSTAADTATFGNGATTLVVTNIPAGPIGSVTISENNTVTLGAALNTDALTVGTVASGTAQLKGGFAVTVTGNAVINGVVGGGGSPLSSLSVTGTTTIAAASVTTSGTQTYSLALTLGANTALTTTNSNVGFGTTVDGTVGTESLAVNAGTGVVTFTGAVGSTKAFVGLTVTNSAALNFNSTVNITGALTQTNAATGGTTFSNTVNVGSATLRGTTFALNNAFTATGAVGVTNSGLLTNTAAGIITAIAGFSTTGDVDLSDGITTTNTAITIGGSLTVAANSTLTSGTATASISQNLSITGGTLTAGGNISVGGNWTNSSTFVGTGFGVTLNGAACLLTSGGSPFYNLTIGAGANVTPQDALTVNSSLQITATGAYINNAQTLTLGGAGGAAGNLTDSTGGTQNLGTVVINTALKTMTTNILMGALTIALLPSPGSLDLNGNVLTVVGAFTNNNVLFRNGTAGESAPRTNTSGTVVYRNAVGGTIQTYGGAPVVADYYDLQLAAAAGTYTIAAPGSLAVADDLTINGGTLSLNFPTEVFLDLVINAPGILQANAQTLTLHENMTLAAGATFTAGSSTVTFVDQPKISVVSGGPSFFNFLCLTSNKTIKFQTGQTITIAPGGNFTINPPLGTVNLLCTVLNPPPPVGPYPGVYVPAHQWEINIPVTATFNVTTVYVECSYSVRIILPVAATFNVDDWTFNWKLQMPVQSSWTLDTNTNGKIDEIAVQVIPGATLNYNFSQFVASVNGYTVTGYTGKAIPPFDTFYIHLAEGTSLDTGAVPIWWIVSNTSLEAIPGNKIVISLHPIPPPFDAAHGEHPVDLAPPVLGYTLAVANGLPEIYAHFSEPVVELGGLPLATTDFVLSGASVALGGALTQISPTEYLIPLTSPFTANDITLPATITVTAKDLAGNVLIQGPNGHRVSDLGLGLPTNGMMEPMFAHDQTQSGPFPGGIGLIQLGGFDGTKWLGDKQNITLQGRVYAPLAWTPVLGGTMLWYDIDVPAADRNGGAAPGVWLPSFTDNIMSPAPNYGFTGLVPTAATGDTQARNLTEFGGSTVQLRNFFIPGTDAKEHDTGVLDFLFQMTPTSVPGQTLYTARVPNPAAANWYQQITPWTFVLRDIRPQRGGVQILNNVIDPDKGQVTTLQYIQSSSGNVTITVFDLAGNIIRVLVRGNQPAATYGVTWDGTNRSGAKVTRGLYFIRIVGPGIDEIRKVLVVR